VEVRSEGVLGSPVIAPPRLRWSRPLRRVAHSAVVVAGAACVVLIVLVAPLADSIAPQLHSTNSGSPRPRRAGDRRHRAAGHAAQVTGERVIRGSSYGSARTREDLPRLVSLYQAGKLRIDELIAHRYALEDANEAFRALAAGELGRGVIVF
jgi:hypothetical protein